MIALTIFLVLIVNSRPRKSEFWSDKVRFRVGGIVKSDFRDAARTYARGGSEGGRGGERGL